MAIKDVLKNILYNMLYTQRYIYVPPCPKCKSKSTGYYIDGLHNESNETIKIKRMKMGELVRIRTIGLDNECNLFCEKCGLEWCGEPITKRLTKEEREEQRQLRGITDEFIYYRNITKENIYNLKNHIDFNGETSDNDNIQAVKQEKKQEKKKEKKRKKNEEIKIKK